MRCAPTIVPTSACAPRCGNRPGSANFSPSRLHRAARSPGPRAPAARRTPPRWNTPSPTSTPAASRQPCAAREPPPYCMDIRIGPPSTPFMSTAAPARASCSATGKIKAACCAGTRTAPRSSRCRAKTHWPELWGSGMKTKHRIRRGDQFRFERGEILDSSLQVHPRPLGSAPCEIEVHLVVARFGAVQTMKQAVQGSADGGREGRESLAGPCLDKGAADHQVNFAMRFGLGGQPAQALGIASGTQPLGHHAETAEELGDLLVVAQFLAGEPRHLVG